VHIDDIIASIELARTVDAPRSRVFNITADEIHTLGEVAAVVRRVIGKLDVSFDEGRDLPNYRGGKMSIARARRELDYAPRYSLEQGVRAYWTSSFQRS
jgi:nucleoside-diphosphate-sugar epimerase